MDRLLEQKRIAKELWEIYYRDAKSPFYSTFEDVDDDSKDGIAFMAMADFVLQQEGK